MPDELLEGERVRSIIGGFFDVYNYYGYGLSERVYAGALEHELRDRGHIVVREMVIDVQYKGRHVAWQRLDMVIDNRVIVENKAAERIFSADRLQLISYLRATRFEVGVLLHFGPVPRFERYIDQPKRNGPESPAQQPPSRRFDSFKLG
jgi:GxxExxY protein